MKTFDGFMAGVNLGGWISQFREANKEHFTTFIVEKDIKQIASWGMDHVRLPIDYMVIEDDDNPFQYKEEGFAYVDQCIEWCEDNNLNIILDLHRAAGYAFHSLKENRLFEDEVLQQRYISLWQAFAKRYKDKGRHVVFELLNEIVEPNSDRWNALSKRAVEGIREIDQNRVIIIGGNFYNSVFTLNELNPIEDNNLVYTFHFYEPHIFTHQRASWEPLLKDLEFVVPYPSGKDTYKKYLEKSEEFKKRYGFTFKELVDKEYLRSLLQPALEFAKERDVMLYCGEYGVIENVPMEYNLNWHRDMCDLLLDNQIGRAVWSYKQMDFPMVDTHSIVRNEELVKIVSKR
ncbi:glycoside hydrolase family 5 protein [Mobilitalea sibirica]|uniref:Glycoside hydrolase family 5 protein n=1 Tax=Mobilitalea sibirica TaxID=1462919 RepID=A0A8J7KZH1_9FIRM|nr:glycoside hydrolase family 5 protein [Mobilitalea sibirica]MBH1940188.1 glycoside hydrolase family 5 protein [Mobilitalea sibirica]